MNCFCCPTWICIYQSNISTPINLTLSHTLCCCPDSAAAGLIRLALQTLSWTQQTCQRHMSNTFCVSVNRSQNQLFHTFEHICTYSRVTQLMLVAGRIQCDQQMFLWFLERNETSKCVKCLLNNYWQQMCLNAIKMNERLHINWNPNCDWPTACISSL